MCAWQKRWRHSMKVCVERQMDRQMGQVSSALSSLKMRAHTHKHAHGQTRKIVYTHCQPCTDSHPFQETIHAPPGYAWLCRQKLF